MAKHRRISRRQFLKGALAGAGVASVSGLLASCAPPATDAPTQAPTAAAPTVAPTVAPTTAPEPVEITHWDWWVTQGPTIDNEIKLFQEANPGITVKKVTNQTDTYPDLFALAVQGGDAPDTFLIPGKPTFQEQAANGWLADLSQFADYQDFVNSFPDPKNNFVEGKNIIDGKTYSAPFDNPPAGAMWNQLWVNTKVFKDAGIVDGSGNAKLPTTLDDLLAAARTIKEKSGGKVYAWGFGGTTNTVGWYYWLTQFSGGDNTFGGFDYKTGKYTFGSNPLWKKAFDTLVTMRDEELIIPDSASVDDEAIRVLFAQHKFGMMIAGTWVINGWKKTNPDFTEFTLTRVPLVDTTEPKSYYYYGPGGTAFGVNPKSAHLDAAWKWFKWLESKDAGVRWVKDGNGLNIHPESLNPDFATNDAMKNYFDLAPKSVRLGPQPSLRNPDVAKVKVSSVTPGGSDIFKGIYSGQITDIQATLDDYAARKQAALEQGIADAVAAGAKVTLDDYLFADWDMTQDYVTKM